MALSSAGLARGFLHEHWCTEHHSADLAQAQLIITELVTNAVRHGGPPIELQMECLSTGGVMLSVSDGTPDVPVAQPEDHARWGGHGVALVDLLSAEWGVHQHCEPRLLEHRHRRHLHDEDEDEDQDVAQDVAQNVAQDVWKAAEDLSGTRGGESRRQGSTALRGHLDHRLFSDDQAVSTSPRASLEASTETPSKPSTGIPAKTVWCRLVA